MMTGELCLSMVCLELVYDQSVIVMSPDIELEHDKILVVAAEVERPR